MPTVMGYRRDAANNWDYWVSPNPKIAYIRITQFTADTYKELRKALDKTMAAGMQGLILDLRFNPGGRLDQAKQVVNLFVNDGVIVVTKGSHRTEEIARARPEDALPRQFPMIVLVNEHSASAAEIVAGSLKDNKRALIMGTRTYGKGSVQEIIPLEPDEGELKLTVAYYYLPSGRLVHKKKGATDWGVDPNVNVPMSDKLQAQVYQEQGEQELFHKPLPATTKAATTQSAKNGSTTKNGATTQPVVDNQLQEAVTTIVDSIKHHGETLLIPATQPIASPATQVSQK